MPDLRERILYPRAGWLSLGLLAVMALAVAWSVQGAQWLEQLEFLAPLAVWAVILGALLGMVRASILITLPLGAFAGAALVLWTIGGEYFTDLEQGGRLLALRGELIDWLVVVMRTGYPAQMAPYAIGLGVLMFATAFTAAHAVYRHHRVLDAILLFGAAIITNMSATFTDLFGHLLLFVLAALLLWLRATLVERQDGWQRRRVNENLEVPAAIMRSGVLLRRRQRRAGLDPDHGRGRRPPHQRVAQLRWGLDRGPRPVRGRVRQPHQPAVADQRQHVRPLLHRAGRVGQQR